MRTRGYVALKGWHDFVAIPISLGQDHPYALFEEIARLQGTYCVGKHDTEVLVSSQ